VHTFYNQNGRTTRPKEDDVSKYILMSWFFAFLAIANGFAYDDIRGDINFHGCAIVCVLFVIADWVVKDLKK